MSSFGFDPQRALDQIKRIAADAPAQLADGVGRLVRDAPPERLEQLMRSPARRALLDGIFWQMPRQLDAKHAAGVKTAIRWCITGRPDDGVDTYLLVVENGAARTHRGTDGPDPKLTVTMDGVEFLRLVSGNSNPMAAYFKGRIQLSGDIMVAAQLAQLFRMPGGFGGEASTANGGGGEGPGTTGDGGGKGPGAAGDGGGEGPGAAGGGGEGPGAAGGGGGEGPGGSGDLDDPPAGGFTGPSG